VCNKAKIYLETGKLYGSEKATMKTDVKSEVVDTNIYNEYTKIG